MRPWEWRFLDWVEKYGDRVGIAVLVAMFTLLSGCALVSRLLKVGGFTLLEIRYEIHAANANANDNAGADLDIRMRDEQGRAWEVGGVLDRDPEDGPEPGAAGEGSGDH